MTHNVCIIAERNSVVLQKQTVYLYDNIQHSQIVRVHMSMGVGEAESTCPWVWEKVWHRGNRQGPLQEGPWAYMGEWAVLHLTDGAQLANNMA